MRLFRPGPWWVAVLLATACGSTRPPDNPDRCAGVTCAASGACHVAGTCDASTGKCSDPAAPDGAACSGGSCAAGVCVPAQAGLCTGVVCAALDACHVAGACDAATGACSNPAAPDGAACSGGSCAAGVCVPAQGGLCAGVVCAALDACHPASCDPASGACVAAPAADGTACGAGLCAAGACVDPAGSCTNGVKAGAETDVDCGGAFCAPCVDGKACAADADCMSGFCAAGHCALRVTALVADPGPSRSVTSGAQVTLDGTRSRAPGGAIATWSWLQTGGPAVTLIGADTAQPGFVAPAPGSALEFTLTVGDGIATSSAPLQVVVRDANRPAETTSMGLILDALHEGRLDRDTAATYLAFSLHGDPRLPIDFQGEAQPSGTAAMHILAGELPTLSPAAQEIVRPFLLPPADPQSIDAAEPSGKYAATASQGWLGVSSAHLVIWYKPSLANGQQIATRLSAEAEARIWPELEKVFTSANMPVLNDSGIQLKNGGTHGKLNVYLVPSLAENANGVELNYKKPPSPSYIKLKQSLPMSGKPMGLFEALAHEMTHSCQDSFPQSQTYVGHRWIFEGIAAWAQDYVYPSTNTEHQYAQLWLERPYLAIDDEWSLRPYGTYLFFQYFTRASGDNDYIRRVFQAFGSEKALDAVDQALPEGDKGMGLKAVWRSFLGSAWNRDETKNFWGVDGLEQGAKAGGAGMYQMKLDGNDMSWGFDVSVPHVSANYSHLDFTDPSVKQIFFYDGFTISLAWEKAEGSNFIAPDRNWNPNPDKVPYRSTTVLVKRDGKWESATPPLNGLFVCQEDPDQRIEEMAIAWGYARPVPGDTATPEGLQPSVWMTNIGCYGWSGTVTGKSTGPGPVEETSATVSFEPLQIAPGTTLFAVKQGSFTWTLSGKDEYGCDYTGSDSWNGAGMYSGLLQFFPQFVDGPAYRGYGGSGGGHEVTYTKTCPGDPPQTSKRIVTWLETKRASDHRWFPQVAGDGRTASDSAETDVGAVSGSMTYTWQFSATSP